MAEPSLQAAWFDGRQAQPRACELRWDGADLLIAPADGEAPRRVSRAGVVWPERTRHGRRQVLLPDGGVLQVDDAAGWDRFAEAGGLRQPVAVRWAASWRAALVALLLLALAGVGAWRWGIPAGAQALAQWMPDRVPQSLGQAALKDLHDRGWLKASEHDAAELERLEAAVQAMVARARRAGGDEAPPAYRLHVRKAPRWLGPNAFALPSGDIVLTDELLRVLPSRDGRVDPALLGVVAHELGHVRQRHGLRMVIEAGALSALMGWWIGDYSALLAGAPALLLQMGYSRDHERAADRDAARTMIAAGIDPSEMRRFFEVLKEAMPQREGDDRDGPAFGLASHPPDDERVRFFEQAGRQR